MSKQIMTKAVRDYLAAIGQRGGSAKGKAKARGDAAHYAAIGRKGARKRWQQAAKP